MTEQWTPSQGDAMAEIERLKEENERLKGAITEAVEAETERCAKLVERKPVELEFLEPGSLKRKHELMAVKQTRKQLAQAIRGEK